MLELLPCIRLCIMIKQKCCNGWDAEFGAAVEMSPWLLHGKQITPRAEMFAGKSGIGQPCEDGFWRAFPADYEPPLRKRDGSVR